MAPRVPRRDGRLREEAIIANRAAAFQSAVPPTNGHTHTRTNSVNLTEVHGLLESPKNLFEYRTTTAFQFPDTPTFDVTKSKKKKPIHVPFWASVPDSLEKDVKERIQTLVVDGILIAISIPFFVLAGIILQIHGKQFKGHEFRVLEQCIKCAATFFPLLFSFIVGRATIKFASWKLEQGTTLGLLESLMGSRTVGGTLVTQLRLWPQTFLGLGLIALWSFSPLGSQAILRMLSTTERAVQSSSQITYVSTRQPSYSGNSLFQTAWFLGFSRLFNAALLAPAQVKTGSMDLWGNVKIPLQSSLANFLQNPDGWQPVPQGNDSVIYSSLFGVPISGAMSGNTTLSLESTYLDLSCSNITTSVARVYAPNSSDGGIFYNPGLISTSGPFRSGLNITSNTSWALGYFGGDVELSLLSADSSNTQCLDCLPTNLTSQSTYPGILLYQDFEGAHNVVSIYCETTQAYVESNVSCTQTSMGQSCAVNSQRPSTLPHQPSEINILSLETVLSGLTELLPLVAPTLSGVDIIQNYLVSPLDNDFIQSAPMPRLSITPDTSNTSSPETESRILHVPLQDFSYRLLQALNAYIQGSTQNSTSFLTGSPLPSSNHVANTSSALLSQFRDPTITVSASAAQSVRVYAVSYAWVAISLLGTTVLLFAAIIAAVFSRLTLTRDYLPYVSSLLRESQFSSFQRGGTGLDGLARTRACKDMKVRLGDVGDVGAGWGVGTGVALPVGRIAIGDWDEGEWGVERVEAGKLYL